MYKLIAALLLSTTAACAITSEDDTSPIDTVSPLPTIVSSGSCAAACRVSLAVCGNEVEDRELVLDCAQNCPFTEMERSCLVSLSCGDDTSVCD